MTVVRALVTSAGSAPAAAVIKALRQATAFRLEIGAVDMGRHAVGFALADWSARVPGASDPGYVPALLDVARRHGVEYVFPVIDEELPVWAAERDTFAAAGVHVFTNPVACVTLANDKWRTADHCAAQGIAHPRCWRPAVARALPVSAYPLFVKPIGGRGSVGAARCDDPEALGRELRLRDDLIVQAFVEGPEFTVDVLTDPHGALVALVPKERLEVKAGMATKSVTRRAPDIEALTERVVAAFGVRGVANVQIIRAASGPVLVEVNPKFATSLPLTVAAGANLPVRLIEMARGTWSPSGRLPFAADLLLLRCWDDHVVPLADGLA